MGQKVNPNVMRTGIVKSWLANWYASKKDFTKYLKQDYEIRNMVFKHFKKALLSKIGIERLDDKVNVILYTARASVIYHTHLDEIVNFKIKICKKLKAQIHIELKIYELSNDDIDAKLISENIAFHLKKRVSFRKLMKRSVLQARIAGAEGIKIEISGRLNGAEIARREWYREGRVPLHTLRANIDYYANSVLTKFGIMGIKIWVYKGEITHDIKYSLSDKSTPTL